MAEGVESGLLQPSANGSTPHKDDSLRLGSSAPTTFVEMSKELRIPLYSAIFLLGVVGNALVIVTLLRNRHLFTVTNLFLLNLSISDLFLGVFCMPFTLVGTLLRQFIFGEFMCRVIPYIQAVSVAVSVWTLVAISLERYYAICQPLHSRRWQTLSHAYKTVFLLWLVSSISMLPIGILSRLLPTTSNVGSKMGRYKCREEWPNDYLEKVYTLFLDMILLIFPLAIMTAAYSKIARSLWRGIHLEKQNMAEQTAFRTSSSPGAYLSGSGIPSDRCSSSATLTIRWPSSPSSEMPDLVVTKNRVAVRSNGSPGSFALGQLIRSTNQEKSLLAKKRVVRMLFVVVFEFFVCWTPLFVINTWVLFDPVAVYVGLGQQGVSFFQLLAYVSSCCNPITYCFMNKKFRLGFLQTFGCSKAFPRRRKLSSTNGMSCQNASRLSTMKSALDDNQAETQL